jgi:predicted DsbA family dithiol-disulfide isomerase
MGADAGDERPCQRGRGLSARLRGTRVRPYRSLPEPAARRIGMSLPTIEAYTDLQCPWAYLACYRLRQIWPAYAGRVQVHWRALSLEYINQRGSSKPTLDAEIALIRQLEPAMPLQRWSRPAWEWPVTCWPALEALACAQAQGPAAAWEMSWALRLAFFAESRSLALRHELLEIAQLVADHGSLDRARFADDWDAGRHKAQVLADSQQGWHTLAVAGSPTFVLPDGTQIHNPGGGDADIDEERGEVLAYTPPPQEPLHAFHDLLAWSLRPVG